MSLALEGLRQRLYAELGLPLSPFLVRVSPHLPPGAYALWIDEVPAARGTVSAAHVYALAAKEELACLRVCGDAAAEPVTGRRITRLERQHAQQVAAAQIPVRSPAELVADHLARVLRRRAADLLGLQDVQSAVESLERAAPALVREALGKVPLPLLTDVLKRLLEEEISILNVRALLEALVSPSIEGDAVALAERCRQALHRYVTHKYAPAGPLYAYLVDPEVEILLRDHGGRADPERIAGLLEGIRRIASGGPAVVLAAPDIRRPLRKLCEGSFPDVAVVTYAELDADLQIRPLGKIASALAA
jgi:type III secretion protein V